MSTQIRFHLRPRAALFLCAMVLLFTLACDLGLGNFGQISFGAPTATRTRTPRPTFTARVEYTSTPEDTATPAATDTPAKTATLTRAPVVVVRTATPRPPAPPPAPTFPVQLVVNYPCNDPGGQIWEVIGSIRKPGSIYLANYTLAILTPAGRILKTANSVSDEEKNNALDISCQRPGVLPNNVKIDANTAEIRNAGQVLIRIIKSSSDATPLSQSVTADFGQPVRWFVFYDAP